MSADPPSQVPRAPDPARAAAATLLALAGVRTGDTVADVACGGGLLAYAAAAAAGATGRVYGVDADGEALAAARAARAGARVLWVRADAARLPFATGSVRRVVCAAVPAPGTAAALAEWRRVLVPGGRLAVSAPADVVAAVAGALDAAGLRAVHELGGVPAVDGETAVHFLAATPA